MVDATTSTRVAIVSSIHTNIAAMAALQTKRSIATLLSQQTDMIATGLRIREAADGAA
ncbi:hypothetical protein [Mesorhizobium sp. 1B3]|uniref:hypothetical protein n=1 Tax=Mesorhizobium sp. 1B3 TaxID=3243599 RepID=UPI003D9661D9